MEQYIVFSLTFLLHFFTTIAISVRIVGVRTKKMAASYAIFNIIFFAARMMNTLQAPLVAGKVESEVLLGLLPNYFMFYGIIISAFLGALIGAFFIPSMQRNMVFAVENVYSKNEVISVFFRVFRFKIIVFLFRTLKLPSKQTLINLFNWQDIPLKIIFYNIIISALLTVSVLSCLYAGYLNPELRSTSLSLNGFIVGLSSMLFMLIVEPHIGITADKVINNDAKESFFRRYLGVVVLARTLGTFLSVFLLKPLAWLVILLAQFFK